jgi:predicted nucleic acid-binding Zn ribbon protein
MKWVSVIDLKARGQQGMDTAVFAQLDRGIPLGPRKPPALIWMGPPNPDDHWWRNNATGKPRWLDWFLTLGDCRPVPKACLACGAPRPHANGFCSELCAKEAWKRMEEEGNTLREKHRRENQEAWAALRAEKAERRRLLLERRAQYKAEVAARQAVRKKKREGKEMEARVRHAMEEARRRKAHEEYWGTLAHYIERPFQPWH